MVRVVVAKVIDIPGETNSGPALVWTTWWRAIIYNRDSMLFVCS